MVDRKWSPIVHWTMDFEPFERSYIENWLLPGAIPLNSSGRAVSGGAPDVLIVSGNQTGLSLEARNALEKWPSVPVYLISDEAVRIRASLFGKRRLVIRNYFSPFVLDSRTFCVPLGFNGEFIVSSTNGNQKSLSWAFGGQVKGDRPEMLKWFKKIPNNQVVETSSFGSSTGIPGRDLQQLYRMAYFVPCPWGNVSPDSFRVMEALQAGAIPVLRTRFGLDYYRFIFGRHPFVTGSTWKEVAFKTERLLSNPEELVQRQNQVSDWYEDFCNRIQNDVQLLLQTGSERILGGEQFRYQKRSSKNLLVRIVFWFFYLNGAKKVWRSIQELPDRIVIFLRLSTFVRKK